MGLFTTLVTLPLAPVRGAVWITEQVAEEADRQLFDEGCIRRELLQLELDCDAGRIGDEERAVLEDDLLERLRTARRRGHQGREYAVEASGASAEEVDHG
jgi:hypothetical protein